MVFSVRGLGLADPSEKGLIHNNQEKENTKTLLNLKSLHKEGLCKHSIR